MKSVKKEGKLSNRMEIVVIKSIKSYGGKFNLTLSCKRRRKDKFM
jgi:hypothetical protein